MILYHAFFTLKPGVGDLEFSESLSRYMAYLESQSMIAGWRLSRRMLGLGPKEMGEFHAVIELESLAQFDAAFGEVSTRAEPAESFHHAVNSKVDKVTFALYRDFPDPWRKTGEEKF